MNAAFLTAAREWKRWQAGSEDPRAAQAEVWSDVQRRIARGSFWPARTDVQAPLEAFGVTSFDDYADALRASFEQTHSTLTGDALESWILSSGSTGAPKMFPGTAAFNERMQRGMFRALPVLQASMKARGRTGVQMMLVPPPPSRMSDTGVPIAFGSALYSTNDETVYPDASMTDPDSIKLWRPFYALCADLASIFSNIAEGIFLIVRRINEDRQRYLDILEGRRDLPAHLPAPAISTDRLALVRRLLASRDALPLDVLFPNLALIETARAATAGLQAEQLVRSCTRPIQLMDVSYNCSEGPIANPIDPEEIGGPIPVSTVVHEFLEPGARGRPDEVLKAWELEEGREYEPLLTTAMGFVRYRIHDIVLCTGHFGKTPRLRFLRRAGAELSFGSATFGEDRLVRLASELALPAEVEFAFGPSADGRALVLHTSRDVPPEVEGKMNALLTSSNPLFAKLVSLGYMPPARVTTVSSPEVWAALRPAHAQAKPTYLSQQPLV